MPHLLQISPKCVRPDEDRSFPFSVPAIRTLTTLDMRAPVTLFVGENGSGKSTLLEGIAAAAELPAIGGNQIAFDDSLAPQRLLGAALRLSWTRRSRQGFFLRAEDFFGWLGRQARDDARIAREMRESTQLRRTGIVTTNEPVEGSAVHPDEREAAKFVAAWDARSHGESFMDLFTTRILPGGLYLLDEPEAPLSPMRQLSLLALVMEAAEAGAQFVIATHSPILLACPNARIYSFDKIPVSEVSYEELEHVTLMRDFLNNPDAYVRRLC